METENPNTKLKKFDPQRKTELKKIDPRPMPPEQQIRYQLDRMQPELLKALPKHMDVDRLLRISMTTIRTTPRLLDCNLQSLLAAVMQAAQLGLEPGLLGQCYFVPYGKEVTFIPGYKGLMKLARRSGNVITIQSDLVYRKDEFTLVRGYEDILRHVPSYADDRGELLGAYAYAITKDGGRYSEFMTVPQLEAIRNRSAARNAGPWKTDTGQMYRKTVIRRLCNYLDLEVEQMEALQQFDNNEFGERPISIELTHPEDLSPTDQLRAKLEAKRQEKIDVVSQGGTHPVIDATEPPLPEPEPGNAATEPKTATKSTRKAAPKEETVAEPDEVATDFESLREHKIKSPESAWFGTKIGAIPLEDLAALSQDESEQELLWPSDRDAIQGLLKLSMADADLEF